MLDFGNKLGVLDFTGDQYFSWIREKRILVRGERGEIVNDEVSWLQSFDSPVYDKLRRIDTGHSGNLEGFHHKGIMGCGEWLYVNPHAPARLSDDEIAVAETLARMGDYVRGGPSFTAWLKAARTIIWRWRCSGPRRAAFLSLRRPSPGLRLRREETFKVHSGLITKEPKALCPA